MCGKSKSNPTNSNCIHKCTLLCHPGPCPPCETMVNRQCGCGKLRFQVKCNSNKIPQCDNQCTKLLNCGIHKCELKCHAGDCASCDIDIEQNCYSHNKLKKIKCGTDPKQMQYKCEEICNGLLNCKEHKCEKLCHSGQCDPCCLLPENMKFCPCDKTLINELLVGNKRRVKCTDPIPTCAKNCEKVLSCSVGDDLHFCQSKCHHGECLKCEKIVKVNCRCGNKSEELPCYEAQKYKINRLMCEKRCTKKESCGRHRCSELCCDIKEHICTLICNRGLNCGKHNCDQLCHKGTCLKCPVSSYDEWICNCGKTIVYPPIKCGVRLPDCPHPCERQRDCEHPVTHNCHSETCCPPCSFLTARMCMGNHEVRHSIPCYMKDVSCGLSCGKELPCGNHKCTKVCHKVSKKKFFSKGRPLQKNFHFCYKNFVFYSRVPVWMKVRLVLKHVK
jgi:transcriptional repressor NF-X1